MTLYQVIQGITEVAKAQLSVQTIVPNDIYRLNARPNVKYGVFAWTQEEHTIGRDINTFAFVFYYADRLTEDKGNEIEVQSAGVQTINNILLTLEGMGIYTAEAWRVQTFNYKFADECAGAYARVRLEVPGGDGCPETWPDFSNDFSDDFNND